MPEFFGNRAARMTDEIAFIEKMFYEYKKLEDRFLESEAEE